MGRKWTVGGESPTALNALKHGLRAARILEEERQGYERALARFQTEYAPETSMEEILIRRLARLAVRLDRAGDLERAGFAQCFSGPPGEEEFNAAAFAAFQGTLARYELSIGRALVKCQHEIERLLRGRGVKVAGSLPIMVDFNW